MGDTKIINETNTEKEALPVNIVDIEIEKKRIKEKAKNMQTLIQDEMMLPETNIPRYPSAQMWYQFFSETDRENFKKQISAITDWDKFEADMKALFPKTSKTIEAKFNND